PIATCIWPTAPNWWPGCKALPAARRVSARARPSASASPPARCSGWRIEMSPAEDNAIRTSARNGWLLSAPALVLLTVAAAGPLLIVLVYSFLSPGAHGNVIWDFSTDGWRGILWSKDIFSDEWVLADAHLTIFWRSVSLSLLTTLFTFVLGFPTAWFIATRPPAQR